MGNDDRYTVERMVSEEPLPMDVFMSNAHVNDMDTFYEWLLSRYSEYLRIRMRLEDKGETDDELYEYSINCAGALREVIVNFRKVK